MNRLRRGVKGYLMALRMTGADTVIFVEGKENDTVYYEEIARRYHQKTGRTVELRYATELPNAALGNSGAGGKGPLIRAAAFLEKWRANQSIGLPTNKEIAFCVDKDVDEIEGKIVCRRGLIYTRLHSVENHLVLGVDIDRALAAAFSTSVQAVSAILQPHVSLDSLAARWRDWVVWCILCKLLEVKKEANYSHASVFNDPAHALADQSMIAQFLQRMASSCGLEAVAFEAKVREVYLLVDDLISAGRFNEVFKGKWYCNILFSLFKSCPALRRSCCTAGQHGIWIGIRATFTLPEVDFEYYEAEIQRSAG